MSVSKIPFATEELGIVKAAVRMGDWLLCRTDLTEAQRRQIRMAQGYLTEQVFPPAEESYDFGFIVERTGLSREWSVCLDSDKLLIFSLYNPGDECPHVGSPEFSDMVDRQDSFTWYADYPHEEAFDVSRWIEEVANPDKYYFQGFSIEADVHPRMTRHCG